MPASGFDVTIVMAPLMALEPGFIVVKPGPCAMGPDPRAIASEPPGGAEASRGRWEWGEAGWGGEEENTSVQATSTRGWRQRVRETLRGLPSVNG